MKRSFCISVLVLFLTCVLGAVLSYGQILGSCDAEGGWYDWYSTHACYNLEYCSQLPTGTGCVPLGFTYEIDGVYYNYVKDPNHIALGGCQYVGWTPMICRICYGYVVCATGVLYEYRDPVTGECWGQYTPAAFEIGGNKCKSL